LHNVEFGFGKSRFSHQWFRNSLGGSMSGRRARRLILDSAETVIAFAADATNSIANRKLLFLGALAPLVVAIPILFRADVPSVAAKGTLSCYDSAGNYEPCVAEASAAPSQFDGRTTEVHQPASWTRTALFQQAIWSTTALYQQGNWPTTVVDQPVSSIASAPVARRGSTSGKSLASAVCRRRFIPCFFSALRRKLTHLASVAAGAGQARPAKEHL
jgi:hypothetical protein